MTEMGAAPAARDFSPVHSITRVFFSIDVFFRCRFVKARPSGARFELRCRIEQLIAACSTQVHPSFFGVVILSSEWRFCAFHPAYVILLRCELLLPFLF